MIPTQTFDAYPEFGDNSTKAAPDSAKYSAGFQQADVLPAEWMNWAWAHNTKGITDLNTGLAYTEAELNALVEGAGLTPAAATDGQVLSAVQTLNANAITSNLNYAGTFLCTSAATEDPTVTITRTLVEGLTIEVVFKNGHYSTESADSMTLNGKTIMVNKAGTLSNFTGTELTADSGNYWFMQAYTTLRMMYLAQGDDYVWLLLDPTATVLSSDDATTGYTIHADGSSVQIKETRIKLPSSQFYMSDNYGMDCQNSDLINANGIYFNDLADTAGEGLNFYRSADVFDRLYVKNGIMYLDESATKTTVGTNLAFFRVLQYQGQLLNSGVSTIFGYGSATITLCNGIARIDFALQITDTSSSTSNYSYGINRDFLKTITGKTITPIKGGVINFYVGANLSTDWQGFGGCFNVNGQFWTPARLYNSSGTVGSWADSNWTTVTRMTGCCFGTY